MDAGEDGERNYGGVNDNSETSLKSAEIVKI